MEHEDAALVFLHACKLGFEGIISKRKDSPYRSGRSLDWIQLKNPKALAVKREAERTGVSEGRHDPAYGCEFSVKRRFSPQLTAKMR
jgi:ATP-dependent DNA ligase